MNKKVVITGGAGFIGSNIAKELLRQGYEVHSVDNYSAGKMKERFFEGVTYHEADIRATADIAKIFSGADVVYHTAAKPRVQVSIEEPVDTTDNNISGTVSVLKAATDAGVRRVVYSSSSSAYGSQETLPLQENMPASPVHPYGLQKYAAEMFTSLWPTIYKLETVSLRYFNIYGPLLDPEGPYALAIGRFITARKTNTPISIYGDGTVTRDFTHVSDAVAANILAGNSERVGKGEVINIGAGRNVSIQALAEMFGGEIVYEAPRIEAHDSLADISRAKELLGWEPKVRLEDGVAELKKDIRPRMILDGRAVADDIYASLKERRDRLGRDITLGIIVSGANPVVESFVRIKKQAAERLGIVMERVDLPDDADTASAVEAVRALSQKTDAVIVQLPLQRGLETETVLRAIPNEKDVDAINPATSEGERIVHAPVALAVQELLKRGDVEIAGKRTVVVGAGRLVGAPSAVLLRSLGAQVSMFTLEEGSIDDLLDADIVVCGAGKPGFIKPEHIKTGVAIIDAGASEQGGVIRGDADPACAEKAAVFTPVPGGVGPVAVAMIFRNLLDLLEKVAK